MTRRLQNHIAENRYTLHVTAVYAVAVWLLSGFLDYQGWLQLGCFALSAFFIVILNNANALIRIYSRMVSCSFLVLSCMACFMFDSIVGGTVQLCFIASYVMLFRCYRDNTAAGWMFYASLCLGLASAMWVQILYFVPFFWLLTVTQLNALSYRTLMASVLGLLTPYWLGVGWFVYQHRTAELADHFAALAQWQPLCDYSGVTLPQLLVFAMTVGLFVTGVIHFWRRSYNDKIRTRQLYGFFTVMALLIITLLILQPQHYDVLMRLLIINTAPFAGHFIALTHTRVTNIAFCAIVTLCLLITAYCLWMSSSIF
jgi:hypothetical protein